MISGNEGTEAQISRAIWQGYVEIQNGGAIATDGGEIVHEQDNPLAQTRPRTNLKPLAKNIGQSGKYPV